MAVARLASIALDCSDSAILGAFWCELLGGVIGFSGDTFVG